VPIECSLGLEKVDQERFHAVDRVVMRHAFDIHNTLGRFLDEQVYQAELAERCRAAGMDVHREVHGRVVGTHKMFLLDSETAWHLSAVRRNLRSYETHIRRLIAHTSLTRVHWVNLDHETITLDTLKK
jgi:hypothetical protein